MSVTKLLNQESQRIGAFMVESARVVLFKSQYTNPIGKRKEMEKQDLV